MSTVTVRRMGHRAMPVVLLSVLGLAPVSSLADLTRTFDSYHAFFVYGNDPDPTNQATLQSDAAAMEAAFAAQGWSTNLYGPGEANGELPDAMQDMLDPDVAQPDELIFFYYSGHGGGTTDGAPQPGSGVADTDGDESQTEDPLPPGVPSDETDETLAFDVINDRHVLDDEFGALIDEIQATSAFVAGALDSCHANGMLDGSNDVQGFADKESVWTTAATEWETAAFGCPNSPFTADLLKNLDPLNPLETLGDLLGWFFDNGEAGHKAEQTYGVKVYEEDLSSTKFYFAAIPEPSVASLLVISALGIVLARRLNQNASDAPSKGRL